MPARLLAVLTITLGAALAACAGTVHENTTGRPSAAESVPAGAAEEGSTANAAPWNFSANAETGTLKGWSVTRNATASAAAAKEGNHGYRINAAAAAAYMKLDSTGLDQNRQYASIAMWVRINFKTGGQSVDLITLKNSTGVHNFDLFIAADTGSFKWDLLRTDWDESTTPVVLGKWYLVEANVSFGNTGRYIATVRIDGEDQGTIASTNQPAATVTNFWLGTNQVKTNQKDYDEVRLTLR